MLRILIGLMATCAMLVTGPNVFADEASQLTGTAWIKRVSTSSTGAETNHECDRVVFRPGHAQVMFSSYDSTFSAADLNGSYDDVFLKTVMTGAIKLVSSRADGYGSNGDTFQANFFPDGNSIVFTSFSSDLAPAMPYGTGNIFTKNLTTGAVGLVSKTRTGGFAETSSWNPSASPDGKAVVFETSSSIMVANDTNSSQDIILRNLATGKNTRVSTASGGRQANGDSYLTHGAQAFSPDGTRVAFYSDATNLVLGDTNGKTDVFIKTIATGAVKRISTSSGNAQPNGNSSGIVWAQSSDLVAFHSDASNLVAHDTNGVMDIFVKNLTTGAVKRISTSATGGQANGASYQGVFSPNGKLFAFTSEASNLVPGDTNGQRDIFVKELATGKIILISKSATGVLSNNWSVDPAFSSDSTMVAFKSWATNLVPGDTSANPDIFVVKLN